MATANIYDLSDVWNASGTAFSAIKMDVTNIASAAASHLLELKIGGAEMFAVRKDGRVTMTYRNYPSGFGEGQYSRFEPYEFGIAYKQGGGTGTSSKDNRLELYLGESDTSAAELSVRHNGNNTGAIIQARNAADTDGIFMDFRNASYPYFRWGNTGPFLVKDNTAILVLRNPDTPSQSQRLWIANTFTPGDVREYLSIGVEATNRFCLRTTGVGGGTQRPLDIDGSEIQLQVGGTLMWRVNSSGLLQAGGSTDSFGAISRDGAGLRITGAAGGSTAHLKVPGVTVASLPAAATAGVGARSFVTDALSPVFGSAVAGGGSVPVPVYSTGSAWNVG